MNDFLNMVFPFFACTFCAGVGLFAGQGYERFRQRCLRNVSLQNIRQLSESLKNVANVCDQETVSLRDQIASLTLDVQTSEAKIASQHCEINRLEEQLAEVQSGNEKLLLASSADGLRIKELERDLANVVGMYAQARTNIINLNGTLDEVREKAYVRDGSRFYRLIPIRSDAIPVPEKKARKKEK